MMRGYLLYPLTLRFRLERVAPDRWVGKEEKSEKS
jgi:hypothetical protein